MHVVTASVHHRDLDAVNVVAVTVLAYGSPVGLAHGKRVHVGAQQDRRPVAVGEHSDHAGATDLLVDLAAGARSRSATSAAVRRSWCESSG